MLAVPVRGYDFGPCILYKYLADSRILRLHWLQGKHWKLCASRASARIFQRLSPKISCSLVTNTDSLLDQAAYFIERASSGRHILPFGRNPRYNADVGQRHGRDSS